MWNLGFWDPEFSFPLSLRRWRILSLWIDQFVLHPVLSKVGYGVSNQINLHQQIMLDTNLDTVQFDESLESNGFKRTFRGMHETYNSLLRCSQNFIPIMFKV